MYLWSSKSNTYFAQDAWWTGGKNPTVGSPGFFRQRILYFFSIIGAIISIAVIGIFVKRKGSVRNRERNFNG